MRPRVRIADRAVMMLDGAGVQLEDQFAINGQTLVFRAAMRALATKQVLLQRLLGFHIGHGD